ncbi:MAG: RDD family protein [Burkholderiaceae bacterium]
MQQIAQSPACLVGLHTPSRWRRLACMLYEGILLFGVVFLAGYLLDTLTQSRSGLILRHARQAFLFAVIGLYFILCWRRRGQTLPMKTWDIRLIERDGRSPSTPRLLLRYLLLWPIPLLAALLVQGATRISGAGSMDLLIVFTPFTLFIASWFDPDGQFLHDRVLGTRLVSVRKPPV